MMFLHGMILILVHFFIIESLRHEGFSICERYGSIYLQKESNGIFLSHGFSFMEKAASMF